jgi:hypothetical protein
LGTWGPDYYAENLDEMKRPIRGSGGVVTGSGVFVVEQEGATNLYFKYGSTGDWEWSPDEENWMTVPETKVSGGLYDGKSPVIKNVQIIISLRGQNFEEGKDILGRGESVSVEFFPSEPSPL